MYFINREKGHRFCDFCVKTLSFHSSMLSVEAFPQWFIAS